MRNNQKKTDYLKNNLDIPVIEVSINTKKQKILIFSAPITIFFKYLSDNYGSHT